MTKTIAVTRFLNRIQAQSEQPLIIKCPVCNDTKKLRYTVINVQGKKRTYSNRCPYCKQEKK